MNLADLAPLGMEADDEKGWNLFHFGPPFLHLPPEEWFQCLFGINEEEEGEGEKEEEEEREASILTAKAVAQREHFIL